MVMGVYTLNFYLLIVARVFIGIGVYGNAIAGTV